MHFLFSSSHFFSLVFFAFHATQTLDLYLVPRAAPFLLGLCYAKSLISQCELSNRNVNQSNDTKIHTHTRKKNKNENEKAY